MVISNIMEVLGALALFIYGMKVMSEGIQKAGGVPLRKVLKMMTHNKYLGTLTGLLVTALLQSSSATTVMTVSFVNAGFLTLMDAAGIIMGANIGTTITAWIISILGFQVKLHTLSIPLFAIAVPLLFVWKGKWRFWAEFFIGFGLLFLGLNFLETSIPNLREDIDLLAFLSAYSDRGFFSGVLFILVGTIITLIVQSSSAAMALILVMSANGWIPLDVAATMVLGMNIGTTATAEVASLVGNVFAKRTARIHTLFNILGVCWMFVILPVFLKFLDHILQAVFSINSAYVDSSSVPIALAAFHTAFNVLNALLFLFITPWLINLASRTVKSKGEKDEIRRLSYIDSIFSTPELAISEVQKKVAHFGTITSRMAGFTRKMLFSISMDESQEMFDRVGKYKDITNRIEKELTEYLMNISKDKITTKTASKIRSLIDSCSELERIADIFYQMSITIDRKQSEKIWFNQDQRVQLDKLFNLVNKAFAVMISNLSTSSVSATSFEEALKIERLINAQKDCMHQENKNRIKGEEYNIYSALIYNDLFSALERIGNHIKQISESMLESA